MAPGGACMRRAQTQGLPSPERAVPAALTLCRLFAPLLLSLTLQTVPMAQAEPIQPQDAQAVQAVIRAQLAALADEDADRAFDAATPALRDAVGSAPLFMALMRGSYPMVFHPRTLSFMPPEADGDTVLQLATLRDAQDRAWLLLFALEKQPDHSWRIAGCLASETGWKST